MVGWSSRNRRRPSQHEIDEHARKYDEWYNALSPDEQVAEKVKQKKNERTVVILCIVACLFVFVIMPVGAVLIGNVRREETWKAAKVVSQDAKTICKEIEYCAPCAPIHHWHKEVFCRNK